MVKHVIVLLGCLCAWNTRVGAQAGAPPPAGASPETLRIVWQDIVRLADQHPRLLASGFGAAAARGAAAAAGAIPNPSLDARLARSEVPEGLPGRQEWSLELTIPLGWIAQRGHRVGAANAQLAVALEEARAVRRDVLLELRTLFWQVACDQARVDALEALQGQTAELVRLVSRRVEKGEARPSEIPRAEIELEKVTSELEADRALLHARRDQLRLWLGLGRGRTLVVEADLASVPQVLGLDTALAAARARHPSLEAARARVRGLSAEVGAEKLARIPGVEIRGFTLAELERRARGGGIVLGLPLWDWNSGRIAQARAQLEAGRNGLEWQARQIESAVIETQGASVATSRTALRYRDHILPRAESAASIMEKTYRLGEASLLEVIDARRVLVETRLEYLAALVRARLDGSRLDALTGQEDAP